MINFQRKPDYTDVNGENRFLDLFESTPLSENSEDNSDSDIIDSN